LILFKKSLERPSKNIKNKPRQWVKITDFK
jgi:hypothetical protein